MSEIKELVDRVMSGEISEEIFPATTNPAEDADVLKTEFVRWAYNYACKYADNAAMDVDEAISMVLSATAKCTLDEVKAMAQPDAPSAGDDFRHDLGSVDS